ncbi:MAG TPA: ABC transporter family substrate-binding protein [Vicinamibacterales bacterium]|nr:ABC transporter family substrate-binding protein [Vicinamibacterales bacterium]
MRRLLVGIALVVIAACGGGTKSAAPVTPPQGSANDINAMSRDQVKDGGTLTWPFNLMPPNLNINELDGSSLNGASVVYAVMPRLFINSADGTPVWNDETLASEPTLVTSPKQVVTYAINAKAIWSDGTPITWQDFYWMWRSLNGTDKRYQVAGTNGYDQIESVARGRNDREVVVTYRTPYSGWQGTFNPLYPASMSRDPDAFNAGWKDRMPVTAGPFRFAGIDQTAKTITLVRNDTWWGRRAKLDRIVYRVIEPDAQIDAIANGEIDLMDVGADAGKLRRARTLSGVDIRIAGGPNYVHLDFEGASPALQDVRVRRAVAMGIDRASIVRALLGPLGVPPTALGNHILMENERGYRDNSGDAGRYDPNAARRLLDEAGWVLQGARRVKSGKPLMLHFVIPSGVLSSRQTAELVQNTLGQIGVDVSIDAVPTSDFFPKYVRPGQFDLTLFSWYKTPYVIDQKSVYSQPTRGADGQLDVRQNFARIGSAEIDRQFDALARELDGAQQVAIANRIDALLWQEVHSLTLYQRPEAYVCKKGLANVGAIGLAFEPVFEDVGWQK